MLTYASAAKRTASAYPIATTSDLCAEKLSSYGSYDTYAVVDKTV